MLVLSRKQNESIVINDNVVVTVHAVSQSRKGPSSGLADLLASKFFVLMRVGRGKHERGFFPCRHTQGQNHPIRWVLIPSRRAYDSE